MAMVWATGEVLGREEYISMHFASHHEEDVWGFVFGEHGRGSEESIARREVYSG
jgi:hypothetical protein